jgi:hypothetical protein
VCAARPERLSRYNDRSRETSGTWGCRETRDASAARCLHQTQSPISQIRRICDLVLGYSPLPEGRWGDNTILSQSRPFILYEESSAFDHMGYLLQFPL